MLIALPVGRGVVRHVQAYESENGVILDEGGLESIRTVNIRDGGHILNSTVMVSH